MDKFDYYFSSLYITATVVTCSSHYITATVVTCSSHYITATVASNSSHYIHASVPCDNNHYITSSVGSYSSHYFTVSVPCNSSHYFTGLFGYNGSHHITAWVSCKGSYFVSSNKNIFRSVDRQFTMLLEIIAQFKIIWTPRLLLKTPWKMHEWTKLKYDRTAFLLCLLSSLTVLQRREHDIIASIWKSIHSN